MQMSERSLAVRDAVKRWLDSLGGKRSDETISTYWYRLKLFVEWCEREGYDVTTDLDGFVLDTYEAHRRGETSNLNTLKNEFTTLKNWLQYCERIEIVDDGLSQKVEPPQVPKQQQSSNVLLAPEDARALLTYYRRNEHLFGQRNHALLELLWHTGARNGAIVGLDVKDLQVHEDGSRYLWFRNRPESETRLKKGPNGERPVLLSDTVADIVGTYIAEYRDNVTDEYGRKPLITSQQGRPETTSIRQWCYEATIPCHHSECPHGKERATCEWTNYNAASKCPSSRAPHQVRSGAITWMRHQGLPVEVVADRVNSSVEIIEEHYDKPDPVAQMMERRAGVTANLDIQESDKNE